MYGNRDISISLKDIQDIRYIALKHLLVTEALDYEDFQVTLTLRAFEQFLKEKNIEPQFVIDFEPKP